MRGTASGDDELRNCQPASGADPAALSRELPAGIGAWRWRRCSARELPAAAGAIAASTRWRRSRPTSRRGPSAVIYLHMSGSPPQQDLFDYKPKLVELNMQPCPDELLKDQRFAFIKGHPKLLGTPLQVRAARPKRRVDVGAAAATSASVADELCHHPLDAHRPVQPCPGRAVPVHRLAAGRRRRRSARGSPTAWAPRTRICPASWCCLSGGTDPSGGKSVWGSGFLPSVYQGVQCRTKGEPILYVSDPQGMDRDVRRRSLDALRDLNEMRARPSSAIPETLTRIAQYELAYRMQISVPEVMDISQEPQARARGLRRRAGRRRRSPTTACWPGGWSSRECATCNCSTGAGTSTAPAQATTSSRGLPKKCKRSRPAVAALINDLKQRGLLDETLVVWGGEFGRTPLNEERAGSKFLGRDHHPHCFTLVMAGGGIKPGIVFGETDDLGYFITKDKVHVHDLQATILHLLGPRPAQAELQVPGPRPAADRPDRRAARAARTAGIALD